MIAAISNSGQIGDASPGERRSHFVSSSCGEGEGWRRIDDAGVRLWMRGYVENNQAETLARRLALPGVDPLAETERLLANSTGHFAILVEGADFFIAAVDWVRSIPLFFARRGDHWIVGADGDRLRRRAQLGPESLDSDAALSVAMAGYTIDRTTLYRGLEMLGPGECVLFREAKPPTRRRYYAYRPWRVVNSDTRRLRNVLADTTLDIVSRMIASLNGRPLLVPLSAGYDSRLIASAARHLGFKDVLCFSYGRPGNFESETSREIANRLGYRWAFVPLTIASQRKFFASDEHRHYLERCDTCASVPFVQDMSAILSLKRRGFVPDDAVIANGNSGDYISGLHIAPSLRAPPEPGLGSDARKERILAALEEKHFALWSAYRSPRNRERIRWLLWQSIEGAGANLTDPDADHGLYEYSEFQDRQCKYVITGQRIYEALGHDWRLPLWDNAYLRFWESVPLKDKANQSLYVDMLNEANWGDVWRTVPVNRKTVRPRWLVPLRLLAKALCAPAGRDRWHRFERRYFQYWMDTTCNFAVVPYHRVAGDRRGHRHVVSWLADSYLRKHDVDPDQICGPRNQ